ncbi:MAG: hypothetical protein ACOYM2_20270, partial [Rectinemataceae bacterium]
AVLQRWHSTTPTTVELTAPTPAEPVVSLEALRQALTKISQDGKAAQIKTLLAEFGARNVGRLVEDKIKTWFVDEVLFGRLAAGGKAIADVKDGEVVIDIS